MKRSVPSGTEGYILEIYDNEAYEIESGQE